MPSVNALAGAPRSYVALAVFALVLALIIRRRVRGRDFPIWTSMMLGATLMILTGVIGVSDAYRAIDFDVIFFLLGMFSIVAGMERSGLLGYLTYRILSPAKTVRSLLFVLVFVMGFFSAFTVNDTMAVMGTPIVITVVKQLALPLETVLVGLAFSLTIGSVMTPIGNPQNMLIATGTGMESPFVNFFLVLGVPTVLNLVLVFALLWWTLKRRGVRLDGRQIFVIAEEHIHKKGLAQLSGACLCLAVGGFVFNDFSKILGLPHTEHLGIVAFAASIPLYVLADERRELLHSLDWSTIVFFVSMFVVMQGLWQSGAAGSILGLIPAPMPNDRIGSILNIMLVSVSLSQILSNVPMVKLYIDVMKSIGFNSSHVYAWLSLAAGSTIAGNLTVLGAASNVIIVEASENRTGKSFTSRYFSKLGVVMTTLNLASYALWIMLVAR